MEIIRAVGALFGIAFGLWGLPAVWEHWSRERRLAARIERQGKVLDRVEVEGVRRTLVDDNTRAAKELAALRRVPLPRSAMAHTAVAFALYVSMFFVLVPISEYFGLKRGVAEPGDWVVKGVLLAVVSYLTLAMQVLGWTRSVVRRDRARFIRLGLPEHFQPRRTSFWMGVRAFGWGFLAVKGELGRMRADRRRERRMEAVRAAARKAESR